MREEIKKERIKKRVLRDYPNAYADHDGDGYKIMSGDVFIAKDYYLPETLEGKINRINKRKRRGRRVK